MGSQELQSKTKRRGDGFLIQRFDGDGWTDAGCQFVFRVRRDAEREARLRFGRAWGLTWGWPFVIQRWRVVPAKLRRWA